MEENNIRKIRLCTGAKLFVDILTVKVKGIVILCPGGGFQKVNIEKEGYAMAPWFHARQWATAVLDYRTPVSPEQPFEDIKAAMEVLEKDYVRVGVMGMSIGGYYAAEASNRLKGILRPDFQILLYSVVSMMDDITFLPARQKMMGNSVSESLKVKYSVELNVRENASPALIIACEDDPAVDPMNSLRYYRSLADAHVPAEIHIFSHGGHGFAFTESFPHLRELQILIDRFLKDMEK